MYSRGYADRLAGPDDELRKVGASASWNLQARHSGFDGWQFAAGIRNRFDAEPPLSNQDRSFQVGYNPQTSSPIGRVFCLRANDAFR